MSRHGSLHEGAQDLNNASKGGWLILDYAIPEVEKLTETLCFDPDIEAMPWFLDSGQDQELEQFLADVPGFYRSKIHPWFSEH